MNRKIALVILYMGLFSGLFSCRRPSRFEPGKPEETYIPSSQKTPALVSVVNVPVEIPLTELQTQLNTQVSELIYEDNSLTDNDNDDLLLKVWKREPLRIEAMQNVIVLTAPLKVWAKKGVTVLGFKSYQETTFALNARFETRISVSPEWQLQTHTLAAGYDWIEKPYIKVALFEIPVAGMVGRLLDEQQATVAAQLDQQVAQHLNLRQHLEKLWQLAHQPVQLSQQYDAWLRITPLEMWMSDVSASTQSLVLHVGMKAYTQTVVGKKPDAAAIEALPARQTRAEQTDDFQIGLTSEISHDAATRLAAAELVGKTFDFQNGKYTITLTSVDLYGNKDDLVIKAGMEGSLKGTLYLVGKPVYNPQTKAIEMKNLDFAWDTKNRLVKAASWMLHGTLLRKMQTAIRFPVGDRLQTAQQTIQQQLSNNQIYKGVFLNGQLDELLPGEVLITPNSILAVVTAKGKLSLKVNGLTTP